MSYLRKRFWVIGVNSMVKHLVGACTICRRYSARSMQQKMADLPSFRVQPSTPPFSKTGIDFFGPWEVKRGRGTVNGTELYLLV